MLFCFLQRHDVVARYQALVGGCEPLQSYLHKRLAENLNSEAALGTVNDVAQCVQWLRSTFLFVRAARDPKKYLGLPQSAPPHLITKKIEDLCIIAMNSLASSGLIKMDEVSCIESTEAGRLLSIYYLDLETMKNIMKIKGNETVEQLLWIVCESHELSDMHLRVDERRCLNALNRNNAAATIRFPMKGKISNRQMKLNCLIQAVLGCLPILEPSLNQEAIKVMRIADRICKYYEQENENSSLFIVFNDPGMEKTFLFRAGITAYVTRPNMLKDCPQSYEAVLNSLIFAKCLDSHLWENSIYVSKQLKGIGPTFSTLLATAGKINFMLLEESHPRDLERIMNKGPPAGNVLRKQISLLPKYQLTMTAIDENSVKLHLILLNQMHLAENIEQLTAGPHHKCYIIVGDTENHLLLLSFFKDKDLINIHDGQISHNIIRRHKFEHKIIAHCISTSFVGIDVQREYIFNSLEMLETGNKINYDGKAKNKHVKQSAITDTFNVRKRKNYENGEICPTENRTRDLPVIERLKYLNQSFIGSHNISKGMKKDIVTLGESVNQCEGSNIDFKKSHTFRQTRDDNAYCTTTASVQNYRETYIEDDVQINKILNEIENEKSEPIKSSRTQFNRINIMTDHNEIANNIYDNKMKKYSVPECKKKKSEISNFDVVINIEKKANLFGELEDTMINEENTFANTVKRSNDQYLEQTKSNANPSGNIASKIITKNEKNPTENKDTSKYDINIISSSKIKPDIDDTLEYCEDMFTGNTLNIMQSNNAEFIFDSEHDTHKDLPLDVLSTEEKQNNEIDCIQNNNNCSIKELRPDYVSLPSCNDEVLIFHDIESLNTKLNHKPNSESILNFKVNCMKNFNSIFNGNKYSIPIPLMDPLPKSKDFLPIHSYLIKTQDNNEGVLSFNNDIISIGNDKTGDMEKLSPRTSCNTPNQSLLRKTQHIHTDNLEQNFNQDNSNIPLSDSTKKLSYSKTHINLYKNKNADSNYCLIRKVKINVDVIETLCASKEKDAVVMIENESNDNEEETKYVTLETKQYEPSANYLPSLESNTNLNQDDHNNIFINLNETPNEDLKHGNGKSPEKFKKYAEKPFPLSPVSSQQNSTVKDIIKKYKDIFSREVKIFSQKGRQPSLAPGNDTKNVNQNKKYKRQYSITNLPNPNLQSSSQINLQYGISRLNEKKPDNFKSNNIDVPKHERNEDELLLNFINIDLPPKLSPTIGSGSPRCDLIPQSINSDCDLNQSMFNPRTLLESLNENDVIPPAPQFRDEINISPNPDNTLLEAEPNSPNYIFKEDNTLDLDNVNHYNEYKITKLTPKKIETWTLARDNVDTELPKSVIICNNKSNNSFLATSRKSKLQNFKYSRKNVLKQRK